MQSVGPTPSSVPSQSNALVLAFAALSACLTAGYGVLFTVVADYRENYGISESNIGWIIGAGFIIAFFSQVFIAPIGDRGHARTLVLGGVLVNAAGLLMMGFGQTFAVIMAGRLISGLAIGASVPAIKRIVVVGSGENIGRNLGWLLAADVFGFAMGPAISAVMVGRFGLLSPFATVAAVSVAVIIGVMRIPVAEGSPDTGGPSFSFDLISNRYLASAFLLGAASFVMIGSFDVLWDVVHDDLGTTDWVANLGITLFAVPLILLAPLGGKLAQRLGPFALGAAGLLVASGFMAAYGFLPTGGAIFTLAMVHAVTDGLTISAAGVAVGMYAPEDRQSGAQGVLGAAQALAAGVWAIVTGVLYESQGRAAAYVAAAIAITVLVLAALALCGRDGLRRPDRSLLDRELA